MIIGTLAFLAGTYYLVYSTFSSADKWVEAILLMVFGFINILSSRFLEVRR